VRRHALVLAVIFCALAAAFLPQGPPTGFALLVGKDLEIPVVSYAPLGAVTGNIVTITTTIYNGGDTASGAFDVSFYVDGVLNSTQSSASLASDARENISFTWTAVSGGHDIKIYADSGKAVAEVYEGNNNWSEMIGVDYPMKGQSATRTSFSNANGPTTFKQVGINTVSLNNNRPLLVYDGKVYATDGTDVISYNATNISQQIDTTNALGLSSIGEFGIYKGTLYVPSGTNRLYAINASNLSQSYGYFTKPGAVSTIDYIAFYSDYVYASSYENLYQLNASNVTQRLTNFTLWSSGLYFQLPAVYNNTVYVAADTNRTLYALNASNVAQQLDSFIHNDTLTPALSAPSIRNGALYISGGMYRFWALDTNNLGRVLSNLTSVGIAQQDYSTPSTIWDDRVAYPSTTVDCETCAGTTSTRRSMLVFNASNVSKWLTNISGGGGVSDDIEWPAIATNNGVLIFASKANVIQARNATDYTSLSSFTGTGDFYSIAIGPDGTVYAADPTYLYAFTQQPFVTPIGPDDYVKVDRDSVNSSVDDSIILRVNLSNATDGMTVTFYINESTPTRGYNTTRTNTTVNGVAMYVLDPNSSYYAGDYSWFAASEGYLKNGTKYFTVYGGVNLTFGNSTGKPSNGANYKTGDAVEVSVNFSSMGFETVQTLLSKYNATVNSTLRPPTEAAVTLNITNTTVTAGVWYGNYTIATEAGNWTAIVNTTAPYFFTNGTSRTFNVQLLDGAACTAASNCVGGFCVHNLCRSVSPYCGDVFCDTGETCTSCAGDCGACPVAATGGGGGSTHGLSVLAKNNIVVSTDGNKLELGRGASEPITLYVDNMGSVVLQDVIIDSTGLPYGWVTISQKRIDSLAQNERKAIKATINVPDNANLETYSLVFTAHTFYASSEYPVEVAISAKCDVCPAPSVWSGCIGEDMTRTSYRCDSGTDYKCQPWTEERSCLLPPEIVNNTWLLVVVTTLGAALLYKFYWKK
jgi:hypothetical protein